jgi:hypothetical protein
MASAPAATATAATAAPSEAPLDLSDLVEEAIDAPRVGPTRERRAPKSDSADNLPHDFCVKLRNLLTTLQSSFPERPALRSWLSRIDGVVLGNPVMEEWACRRWHTEMTMEADGVTPRVPSMYELTADRRIDEVFDAKIWVFEEIDGRGMYQDPGLWPADKEVLCRHFDKINAVAQAYARVPPGLAEAAAHSQAKVAGLPVTSETIQSVMQNIIGVAPSELGRNPEASDKIMGWARTMTTSFTGTDMSHAGPMDIISTLTRPGGPLDAMKELVGGELAESCNVSIADMLKAATDGLAESRRAMDAGSIDPEPGAFDRVLAVLGGGGGAAGSSGTGAGAGAGAGSGSGSGSYPH